MDLYEWLADDDQDAASVKAEFEAHEADMAAQRWNDAHGPFWTILSSQPDQQRGVGD